MKKEILKFTNTPSFSTFIYSIMDEKSFLLPSLSSSTSSLPTSDSALSLGTLCVACDGFACGNATYAMEMAMRGVLEKQNS
jgi:hypothetical protein